MTVAAEVPAFATAEGLRLLLVRLCYSGLDGWRTDPEAAALMLYAMEKYGALARKQGFEPVEAATAAFDAMRTRAVRVADDPWAVVTKAVELTLIYEARAEGLLCSPHQARRDTAVGRHDAERFSDRETELADYHPALWVAPAQDQLDVDDNADQNSEDEPTNAFFALAETVAVFSALGWPEDVARSAVEYVGSRLMRSGNRGTAFEALRRDRHAQALLDVDQRAWLVFLRVVLGNQHPDRRHTAAGRGLLLRLAIGDRVEDLVQERSLVAEIARIRFRPRVHA
jgi:hypothetical protein